MESLSNVGIQNAESVISTGTMSVIVASSEEISLSFSFLDEISADLPTEYDVLSEIFWKCKLPVIVKTPPEEGPRYSEGIVFPDNSFVTCCSELTLSSEASEEIPVAPVQRKSTGKCGMKKPLWKRLRSLFTCCCSWKKCGRKDQVES